MNGLDFCKKAYALFENIRRIPGGVEKLRLRSNLLEKKLIEELLPISRYIQARYSHGRQIKIRWINGNQSYDAHLLSNGFLVDKGFVPPEQYIEVTTAVHENDHILRHLINKHDPTFDVKGIRKESKTKKCISEPYVYENYEAQEDLTIKILGRINLKDKIDYPNSTILVIQCFLDTLFLEDEWEYAIQILRDKKIKHRFYEIFVFDSNHYYSATLYSNTTD